MNDKMRNTLSRCIVQKDKARRNLVNVSSKYTGDHQSLLCSYSSSSILIFLGFFSFVPKMYCLTIAEKKTRGKIIDEKLFDKILNSFFIVSKLFFVHKLRTVTFQNLHFRTMFKSYLPRENTDR